MLRPDYPIATPRLLIRPLVAEDAPAVFAYQSRPDVCRYIPYSPRTLEQVGERISAARSTLDEPGQALVLGVVRREDEVWSVT